MSQPETPITLLKKQLNELNRKFNNQKNEVSTLLMRVETVEQAVGDIRDTLKEGFSEIHTEIEAAREMLDEIFDSIEMADEASESDTSEEETEQPSLFSDEDVEVPEIEDSEDLDDEEEDKDEEDLYPEDIDEEGETMEMKSNFDARIGGYN